MAYKIIVSARAQKEIESVIDYYSLKSVDAPQAFITILETHKTVRILSCFHHKLNPDKRPKI